MLVVALSLLIFGLSGCGGGEQSSAPGSVADCLEQLLGREDPVERTGGRLGFTRVTGQREGARIRREPVEIGNDAFVPVEPERAGSGSGEITSDPADTAAQVKHPGAAAPG